MLRFFCAHCNADLGPAVEAVEPVCPDHPDGPKVAIEVPDADPVDS